MKLTNCSPVNDSRHAQSPLVLYAWKLKGKKSEQPVPSAVIKHYCCRRGIFCEMVGVLHWRVCSTNVVGVGGMRALC